jgi:hypothetical protein
MGQAEPRPGVHANPVLGCLLEGEIFEAVRKWPKEHAVLEVGGRLELRSAMPLHVNAWVFGDPAQGGMSLSRNSRRHSRIGVHALAGGIPSDIAFYHWGRAAISCGTPTERLRRTSFNA